MRPAAALGMSAAFFALVVSMIPHRGVTVADPDASATGFEMVRHLVAGFTDWRVLFGDFTPLLALGGVLAYARWRTRSLWLSVGLHTGWLFSRGMLASLSAAAGAPLTSGSVLQQGFVPMTAILVAGFLAHYLTANEGDETIVHS
jgi:membrane protease YdiL (CAAX protease family)